MKLPGYGVYVSASLLGVGKSVVFEGRTLEVTFPSRTDAFQEDGKAFGPTSTLADRDSDEVTAQLIEQVRVDVAYEIDFTLPDFLDPGDDYRPRKPLPEGSTDLLGRMCMEAHALAARFVSALCAQVRTTLHQDWLGTSSEAPAFVTHESVIDSESGRELPFHSLEWRSYSEIIGPHQDLNAESWDTITSDVLAGRAPAFARELIYDALYLGRVRRPPDLRLAVLCVAIGVEAESMNTLREACPSPARGLLEHLVASPRDFTMAMETHLDKTMDAVCGRSLRKEDKALYQGAVKLFRVRNAIAHGRRDQPESEAMVQAIKDGVEVYRWLRGVSASGRTVGKSQQDETPLT